jgi:hypothetical protein
MLIFGERQHVLAGHARQTLIWQGDSGPVKDQPSAVTAEGGRQEDGG